MKLTWKTFKAMNTPTEWQARFGRNKWIIAWGGAAFLFLFMVGCIWWFDGEPWQAGLLQALGTATPVYAAVIIFLQSKAASDSALRTQLEHHQQQTERHIQALTENANRQINEYSRETLKVVSKLQENSLLLAELLKRELEDAIGENATLLEKAERDFNSAHTLQLLRTPQQREQLIAQRGRFVQQVRGWGEYLQSKYNNLTAIFRSSL